VARGEWGDTGQRRPVLRPVNCPWLGFAAAIIIARLPPLGLPAPAVRTPRLGHLATSLFALREWVGLLAQRMGV
jgi:hypothetical protein